MIRPRPFLQILLARLREAFREPEVIFWVFVFPVLLALGLGIAFRNKPPEHLAVVVIEHPGANAVAEVLNRQRAFDAEVVSPAESESRLRLGKAALVIVPVERPVPSHPKPTAEDGSPSGPTGVYPVAMGSNLAYEYRFDPTRPDSALARALVDEALQRASGRVDAVDTQETPVTEPGARYIDFLIPGLIGMNLMSGGMWGLGFVIVDMRSRKLLRRLVASPMRRSEFLAALMTSRLVFMLIEVVLLLVFGWMVFNLVIRGSILTTLLIGWIGAMSFGALGLLVASRAQKIEAVSGLMNLVMLPMFVFSGVFFSSDRFPDFLQPFIKALPLTLLNDAFRAVIIEGADLPSQIVRLAGLALWGTACFVLANRWFRWT